MHLPLKTDNHEAAYKVHRWLHALHALHSKGIQSQTGNIIFGQSPSFLLLLLF